MKTTINIIHFFKHYDKRYFALLQNYKFWIQFYNISLYLYYILPTNYVNRD